MDTNVVTSTTKIENLQWDGTAAAAAKTRMELEKACASKVGEALMGLETAFNLRVKELGSAKDQVISMRNIATTPPPGGSPAFTVSPEGTVSPEARIQWFRDHSKSSDGKNLVDPKTLDPLFIAIRAEAAARERDLTGALQHAESVANTLVQEITRAKTSVDEVHTKLGDPTYCVTSAAPANVNPASVNQNSTTQHQTQNYSHGNNNSSSHNSGSNIAYSTSSNTPPSVTPSGDEKEWIAQAKQILISMGYSPSQIDEHALEVIIQNESSGNPHAINGDDINAQQGHPSKGLMQTIDSTFNRWAAPGHTDIWNPVDNIVAGARYSIDRYGTLNHPGVVSYDQTGVYHGY
ncbi:lytic transglycosylase domain-containing protein [Nocardia macrotermitis]|uniref:lytic transglycosylase domain-containing protein n=1 Tax=Nocardia macrotermitis TaxID=2585198 RepID=UPI0029E7D07D|nr:transglycosylase SLT domain-containing protein [Nocardia macrotermitis]